MEPLFGWCCEGCCWATAAANEVLIGGGLGLFLWARDGELVDAEVAVLLLVRLPFVVAEADDGEEDDELPNIELDVVTGDEIPLVEDVVE